MDWNELIKSAFNYATEVTTKYGPIAWDTMLWLKRIEAIQSLFYGVVGVVLLIGIFITRSYVVKNLISSTKGGEEEKFFIYAFSSVATAFAAIAPIIMIFSNIFDIWVWVAIFKPELAIAHDLFLKASK